MHRAVASDPAKPKWLPVLVNSDRKITKRIAERFEKLGGMTAELSKKIGM